MEFRIFSFSLPKAYTLRNTKNVLFWFKVKNKNVFKIIYQYFRSAIFHIFRNFNIWSCINSFQRVVPFRDWLLCHQIDATFRNFKLHKENWLENVQRDGCLCSISNILNYLFEKWPHLKVITNIGISLGGAHPPTVLYFSNICVGPFS